MKPTKDLVKYEDNVLVARWRDPLTNKVYWQRKRLGKDIQKHIPNIKYIQEAYYHRGKIGVVVGLKKELGYSLSDAKALIDSIVGRR